MQKESQPSWHSDTVIAVTRNRLSKSHTHKHTCFQAQACSNPTDTHKHAVQRRPAAATGGSEGRRAVAAKCQKSEKRKQLHPAEKKWEFKARWGRRNMTKYTKYKSRAAKAIRKRWETTPTRLLIMCLLLRCSWRQTESGEDKNVSEEIKNRAVIRGKHLQM